MADGEGKVPKWVDWLLGITLCAGTAFVLWTALAWWLKRHTLLESADAPAVKKEEGDAAA